MCETADPAPPSCTGAPSAPQPPPPPPDTAAFGGLAEPYSVYEWAGGRADARLGVGHPAVVEGTRPVPISGAGLVETDHERYIQEISRDWMRVRVREPAWTCFGDPDAFSGTEREGWVKWRGPDRGPWVWYPTRGC
ncbi:MAG: hypothetical protein ACOC8B_08225 [Gemmatimonadota bacterium]